MSNQNERRKGISKSLKLFFGVGDFGFGFMTNIETYFFNFFLTNIAQFALPVVTLITTVASVVDASLSWIYGAIINSTKAMRWGKYRSWLVAVPWVVPFLYAFQFLKIGDGVISIVIIIAASVLSHIAWNIPYVANVSMINIAAKNPEERVQLSSTRALWSSLSRVIYSYVGPGAVAFLAGVFGEKNGYGAVAFVFAALMAALYFSHFVMFKGYEEVETSSEAGKKAAQTNKTSGKDLVKSLVGNPSLMFLMLADFSKYMYSFVANGIAIYYFTYVAKDASLLAVFILISNLLGVAGSYLSKHFANKFTARNTMILSYFLVSGFLMIGFLFYTKTIPVIICMSMAQFFSAVTNVCGPAMYADSALFSEWKTGKNATGWVMGLMNVPLKVGVVSRGIVISSCLAIAAFNPSLDAATASPELMRGISIGFMVIPAIAILIGALVLIFGFKITRDKVVKYQEEIETRKSKA